MYIPYGAFLEVVTPHLYFELVKFEQTEHYAPTHLAHGPTYGLGLRSVLTVDALVFGSASPYRAFA